MKKLKLILLIAAGAVGVILCFTGCMTATITAPDGTQAKASGFLMTVSDLKHQMLTGGDRGTNFASTFSLGNASGDVQMVNALAAFAEKVAVMAAGAKIPTNTVAVK